MRDYRVFHEGPLEKGAVIELEEGESRHLIAVRRCRVGDEVLVMNGAGIERSARVTALGKKTASVELRDTVREESVRPRPCELHAALTKSPAYDDMLQRAVELGMTAFQPLVTERAVVELDERRAGKRTERWRRMGAEAIKQCERLWLPEFREPMSLEKALRDARGRGLTRVFLAERSEEARDLKEVLRDAAPRGFAFFVGPEGGWTNEEVRLAKTEEAVLTSLGRDAILRTETAALAALAGCI